jgi:hypothetical protein
MLDAYPIGSPSSFDNSDRAVGTESRNDMFRTPRSTSPPKRVVAAQRYNDDESFDRRGGTWQNAPSYVDLAFRRSAQYFVMRALTAFF